MIAQQRLDELWDFADPRASEQRLRAAAEDDPDNAVEWLTQVARALGLQEAYAEARQLLDRIDTPDLSSAARVRIALERGRVENSAGAPGQAVSHFDDARRLAERSGLQFLQVDALHMLAIADPDQEARWTTEGISVAAAAADDRTLRWLVSLHNNHGWTLYDNGDFTGAVAQFERALEWAEQVGSTTQQQYAREALQEARAAVDRQPD